MDTGTRRNRILFGIGFFLLLSTRAALGACLRPGMSGGINLDDPFHYSLALVESYSYAQSALTKVSETNKSGSDSFGDLSEMIYSLKSAAEEYNCAAESVALYTKSKDEKVALSAEAATATFRQLMELDEQLIGFIKEVMDGKVQPGQAGNFAERLADRRVQLDETWRLLIMATVALTHALVQAPPASGDKLSILKITDQQRKSLAERLERDFGPQVRSGMKAGQIPLVASAAMLYGFISNADWKSSPTPSATEAP